MRTNGHTLRAIGVVVGCTLGNLVSVTPVINGTFGIFLVPVTQALGWTRTELSVVLLIMAIVGVVGYPVAGYLADRFGVRPVALIGQCVVRPVRRRPCLSSQPARVGLRALRDYGAGRDVLEPRAVDEACFVVVHPSPRLVVRNHRRVRDQHRHCRHPLLRDTHHGRSRLACGVCRAWRVHVAGRLSVHDALEESAGWGGQRRRAADAYCPA